MANRRYQLPFWDACNLMIVYVLLDLANYEVDAFGAKDGRGYHYRSWWWTAHADKCWFSHATMWLRWAGLQDIIQRGSKFIFSKNDLKEVAPESNQFLRERNSTERSDVENFAFEYIFYEKKNS